MNYRYQKLPAAPATQDVLDADMVPRAKPADLVTALRSLERRSLLERRQEQDSVHFSLQNVLLEFQTDRLIDHFCAALESQDLATLSSHALLKTQAEEYVTDSQRRVLMEPLGERLYAQRGKVGLENRLHSVLAQLRARPTPMPGYAAGNVANMLIHLGVDLSGLNLAGLDVSEMDLRGVNAQGINLAGASLQNCAFTDTFGGVYSVALSSDGRYLAVGTKRGELCLWRIDDGQPVARISAHRGTTWSTAFSPDNGWLATCGNDGVIRLWQATGLEAGGLKLVHSLPAHSRTARSLAFSPDGSTLVSGGEDGAITLWDIVDLADGQAPEPIGNFEHGGRVFRVVFNPDGQHVASAGSDRRIVIWRIDKRHPREAARAVQVLVGHEERIAGLDFSPDGTLLASNCVDRTLRLWAWRSGECRQILELDDDALLSVAFNPRGDMLASAGHGGTVRLWQLDAAGTATPSKVLTGQAHGIWDLSFSADGRLLTSGGDPDQKVRLWQVDSGRTLRSFVSHVIPINRLAFHPLLPLLVSGSDNGLLYLWDVDDVSNVLQLDTAAIHSKTVSDLAWLPDCDLIVSASFDGTSRLWGVESSANKLASLGVLGEQEGWITALAVSPDGCQMATAGLDGNIRIWPIDPRSPRKLSTPPPALLGHKRTVWSLAYASDGRTLISGGEEGIVRLWDTVSGQSRGELVTGLRSYVVAATTEDGRRLAIGTTGGQIQLWDPARAELVTEVAAHSERIYDLGFTADGNALVSASANGGLGLWSIGDVEDRLERLFDFSSHTGDTGHTHAGRIASVALSADGILMASAGDDAQICLWNIRTDENLSCFRPQGLYAGMDIRGVTGITEAQKSSLRALDAIG